MPNDWEHRMLIDVAEVIISNVDKKTKDDETPVRLCNYTDVYYNQFIRRDMAFMSATAKEREIKKCTLFKGDVIITKDSEKADDIGVPAYIREHIDNLVCGYHLVMLRPKPDMVDGAFLFYALSDRPAEVQFHAKANGITRFGLRKNDIETVEVPIPPLPVQRQIGTILASLEDKIDLNRRVNRTLERMAQAMFKSWFIDFDPVRAKAEGDPTAGGLPGHLVALFPDRLVDSELGEIPEGWEVKSLDEAFDVNPKRKLSKGTLAPFLEMSNMPTKGPSPAAWRLREMTSGTKFIKGDTLVARITPCLENGKTAFVDFLHPGQVGWGSTEYIVLRPKGDIPPVFAYLLARTESFRTFAIRQMTGSSGRQRVPPDSLSAFQLALPAIDSALHKAFGDQVNPHFDRISLSARQNRKLAGLRDTLLPKLLNGELEVPEAEAAVEKVAS